MSEIDLNKRIRKFLSGALDDFNRRDFDSAIERLKAAETLDPGNPETLYNLGVSHCRKSLFVEAIDYFKKLINLPSSSVDILSVLKLISFSLIKLESCSEALGYAEDGLALSPDDTVFLNIAGYCRDELGDTAGALEHYRKIIDIDDSNSNAHNSIAFILARTEGDLNTALNHAKKAIELGPENAAYLDTIGFVYMKKGNTELSKNYLKKALSISPESREIKNHINMLLKIKGEQA